MELQLDVGHVESHFGPFGYKIGAQFTPNVPKAQKIFLTHRMELLGTWLIGNLILVCLDMLLVLVQDSCMV
jgi:mannose/fructose/N-acetylgalactosamine-specific phosphotransferase system component IID